MTIDNENDLAKLREISQIVFETLHLMRRHLRAGITTAELDKIGAEHLASLSLIHI